jgi:hypothetical protein
LHISFTSLRKPSPFRGWEPRAHGLEVAGVTLLLKRKGFVINGEAVADENAEKVLSDDLLQLLPGAAGNNAVEGQLRVGEVPEGVSGSPHIPACLVAVEHFAMANFFLQSLVFGGQLGG